MTPQKLVEEILEKAEKATPGIWDENAKMEVREWYTVKGSFETEVHFPTESLEYIFSAGPQNIIPLLKLLQEMASALEWMEQSGGTMGLSSNAFDNLQRVLAKWRGEAK